MVKSQYRYQRKDLRGSCKYTKKQLEVLKIIDDFYTVFGEFPTYAEVAKRFKTSRQDIDNCLAGILAKLEKLQANDNCKIDFEKLVKEIRDGWVGFKIVIKNGNIHKQVISFKNNTVKD